MRQTASQLAKYLGLSKPTVASWVKEGLKCERVSPHPGAKVYIESTDVYDFLMKRAREGSGPRPGSERDRLAREQADRVALENAERRREVILASQVEEVFGAAVTLLAGEQDGIAGRIAKSIAGETDAGVVRVRILDELRRARAAYADELGKLVQACRDRDASVRAAPAAEAPDGGRVGGQEPEAPAG